MEDLRYSKLMDLIRTLGHDMRAPLGTIISTSDMLVQGLYEPLTPKQTRANERIRRNSHRVLAMLDDFVTYVKADAYQISFSNHSFDPRKALLEWAQQIEATAKDKGLRLHVTTHDAVPSVLLGDVSALSRAVLPLLWNAVTFTSHGEIHLESDWAAQHWLIKVRDSGPGIAPENAPLIFDPFWRGEDRSQIVPSAGAGLGLAVAAAIVKAMHGSLTLEQTSSSGSVFALSVPATTE